MLCNYDNPVLIEQAREARRNAYRNAKSEDELLAAAESTWEEYIPFCTCEKCLKEHDNAEG